MWKNSTKLGLGVSKLSNGGYVVVGRYSPGGNVTPKGTVTGYIENVLPLLGNDSPTSATFDGKSK